ncbi:MAG: hypothetical protein U0166_28970 [Acidobacteriota bacterium]
MAALLGRRDDAATRRWWWCGLGMVTVFLGTALAAYLKGPDWMWMYFLDPPPLSAGDLAFMGIVLYYLPYGAAFAATRHLERARRGGGYAVLAGSVVLNLYIVARLWDRYFHVGTRAEYLAGKAPRLVEPHALTATLNAGGAALGIAAIVLVVLAVRDARSARMARL